MQLDLLAPALLAVLVQAMPQEGLEYLAVVAQLVEDGGDGCVTLEDGDGVFAHGGRARRSGVWGL